MADVINYDLNFGIDLGTSASKVACSVFNKQKGTTTTKKVIRLDGKDPAIPSCFAFWNGRCIVGKELVDRVALPDNDAQHIPAEMIIECAKLAYYEPYWNANGPAIKAIKAKLAAAGKTLDEAMTEYCKALVTITLKQIENSELGASFRLDSLRRMKKHARLSMPQQWTPKARARILRAVNAAGIHVAVPASEPQCAIADFLDKTSREQIPILPKAGEYILVADLGCGTGDFVLYQVEDDLDINSHLGAVAQATGELCGSHWVNEAIFEHLDGGKEGGKLRATFEGKMSAEAFRWHLLQGIEAAKTNRKGVSRFNPICVYTNSGERVYDVTLTSDEIEVAHEGPVDAIIAAIDSLIAGKPAPKLLILAGGFRKSEFVKAAVKDRYEKNGETAVVLSDDAESTMVAEGALSSRYSSITTQKLPFVYSYALLRDEYADPDEHPDCYRKRDGKMVPVKKRVKESPYGNGVGYDLVIDRLIIVLDNQDIQSATPTSRSHDLEYATGATEPKISATFVYLDPRVDTFWDHESSLEKSHDAGLPWGQNKLRKGVHEWMTVTADLDGERLAESGCEMWADNEGEVQYHFQATVTIRYQDETNMTINWRIKAGDDEWDVASEIWNSSFSEFSREHDDME